MTTRADLVLGVGCERGTSPELFERGVLQTLRAHGLSPDDLRSVASIDKKRDEPALCAFVAKYRLAALFYSAETLAAVSGTQNGSARVQRSVGTPAVSEPAALLASGASTLLVNKTIYTEPGAERSMTIAIARSRQDPP